MINEERLVERFLEYVQIDSPTKEELEFAKHIKAELEKLGLEVYMDDAGESVGSNAGNVVGRYKGNPNGTPILFSCHMDTVSPGRGIKPQIKDGVIYSDGTTILGADDKAGIAAVVEAIEVIKEKDIDHGDIEVVFSIFEEGGLYGAKNLDYSKINAKKAFVLDSSGQPGTIIYKGPAQNKLDIKFIGKEAHAGVAPESGISAIVMAAEAISNMNLLRVDKETTANIGIIHGGAATNIVTKEVILEGEARSLDNNKLKVQTDHMVHCCNEAAKKYKGEVEINVENVYDAFEVSVDHELVKDVEAASETLGLPTITIASGGGSDTNIFNSKGIAAINLAIGEMAPHTLEEHIYIKDLVNSSKLVLELIKINL